MQPKQPKAETQAMVDATYSFYEWIRGKTMPGMQPSPKECYEAGYSNALAGIPNPEAVRELIEEAKDWASLARIAESEDQIVRSNNRLYDAIQSLSATSASPQQK